MTAKSGRQLTWSTASIGSYSLGEPVAVASGEVPARREADHADSSRVDAPFRGAAADQADGPLGVKLRARGRLAPDSPGRRGNGT